MNRLHPLLTEAAAEAARIARAIPAAPPTGHTPCAEMDLRALLHHWILYTSHGLECRALRRPIPEALLERDFTADPGWADAYAAQLDRALAAWADPAAWEGDIVLGEGWSSPAPEIASLILTELTLHGWDVAVSTGQDIRFSEALADEVLTAVETHAETFRRYDGFADPVTVAADAPAFDRALALSGRDPHWKP